MITAVSYIRDSARFLDLPIGMAKMNFRILAIFEKGSMPK